MIRLLFLLIAILLAGEARAQNGQNYNSCTQSAVINCPRAPIWAVPPVLTGSVDYVTQTPYGGLRVQLQDGVGNDLAPITPVATTSLASSLVLKAAPGQLYSATVTTSTTPGYVMVLNATAPPADGAVTPWFCFYMQPLSSQSFGSFGAPADLYTIGITVVFSTTGCLTKTASATAFISGSVR